MITTEVDNIIITQEDYKGEVGNLLINYTGSYVYLIMTAKQGYAIDYTDFSWDGTPGSGVDNVEFSSYGRRIPQVQCKLTINPNYEIPVGGISFPVCISGKSVLIPITLNTTFAIVAQNATRTGGPTLPGGILSNGDRGSTTQVIDATLTADTGHRFASTSQGSYNITNSSASSSLTTDIWNVIETWGTDPSTGDYISYRVQADYTFPAVSAEFDFTINGTAEAIPVEAPLTISSYSGDFSNVSWKGTGRGFTMFGDAGATFSYSLDSGGSNYGSGNVTVASEGYGAIPVLTFPQRAATGDKDFILTITAGTDTDLNATAFGGSTSSHGFTIKQRAQDTIFITRTVNVQNSISFGFNSIGILVWTVDGLEFSYPDPDSLIGTRVLERHKFDNTSGDVTEIFEVPVDTTIDVAVRYTGYSSVGNPGHYYLQSIITGMASGNGTIKNTVPNTAFGSNDIETSFTSPSAGVATAGTLDLRGKDTAF